MPWYTIVGISSSAVGLIGALVAIARWLHKIVVAAVVDGVKVELADIQKEHRPNGGDSMKDQLTRVDQEMSDFKEEASDRFDRLDNHLKEQDNRIDSIWKVIVGRR